MLRCRWPLLSQVSSVGSLPFSKSGRAKTLVRRTWERAKKTPKRHHPPPTSCMTSNSKVHSFFPEASCRCVMIGVGAPVIASLRALRGERRWERKGVVACGNEKVGKNLATMWEKVGKSDNVHYMLLPSCANWSERAAKTMFETFPPMLSVQSS